jgi:Txe/YoeB family toxin of Txe-Axe toxin-antitoxin module
MEKSINNETRLAKMEQKIDNIVEDVKEISKDIKDHIRWEGEKYEKLDSKYSGKWVEKLTLAIAGGLVIAILTFLLK